MEAVRVDVNSTYIHNVQMVVVAVNLPQRSISLLSKDRGIYNEMNLMKIETIRENGLCNIV